MTIATDLPPGSPARPGLLALLVIAVAFAAVLPTLLLPHDPYIRYQQLRKTIQFRAQYVFERIHFDRTPIDVAIIGNSRTQAGVSTPQLQTALRQRTGLELNVANLGMPQEGRNLHYVIAKQLLEEHPETRLIILSAIEQMPRESHPAFRDLADARDVLTAPVLLNSAWANDVSVLPFRQLSLFVQTVLPGLFGNQTRLDPDRYSGPTDDPSQSFTLPDGRLVDRDTIHDPVELGRAAAARIAGITPPVLGARGADYEFAVERAYTRAIVDLARSKGVAVAFLYLPIYRDPEPVREQAYYDQFGPTLWPRFLDQDYRLYSDYGHLNVHGARLVSKWLADRIVDLDRRGLVPAWVERR